MKRESIAIKPANAQALRGMIEQIKSLEAQIGGHVNALALSLDVPPNWRFDSTSMEFVPPPAPEPDAAADAQEARNA